MAGLPAALAALTPAEWASLKAGTQSRLEEKPTSIGERAERLYGEARALRPLQAAAWPCRPRRASGPTPRLEALLAAVVGMLDAAKRQLDAAARAVVVD